MNKLRRVTKPFLFGVAAVVLFALLPFPQRAAAASVPFLVQSADCTEIQAIAPTVNSGQTVTCVFFNKTLGGSGDCIVGGLSLGTTSLAATISDDGSNSYNTASRVDSGNAQIYGMFYSAASSVAQTITLTFTATTHFPYAIWAAEFSNCGALDVASPGATGSSTSVTAGLTTPTATGDLMVECGFNDSGLNGNSTDSWTAGAQANFAPAESLFIADELSPTACQWGVYSSTAAINPTFTQSSNSSFIGLALFFKSATGPSAPTGVYINTLKHLWFTNGSGTGYNASQRTEQFACPATSNFMYIAMMGGTAGGDTLTGVTDSHGQTWTETGPAYNGVADSTSHNFYRGNATVSPNQTITMTGNFFSNTAIVYCGSGLATAPFDHTATNSGNQSSTTGTLGPTISGFTPSTPNGVVFAQVGVSLNTLIRLTGTGQLFHSCLWSGELPSINGCDQNNGWGAYYNTNTAAESFTWNQWNTSVGSNAWASRADAFEGAAAGAAAPQPPTALRATVQ